MSNVFYRLPLLDYRYVGELVVWEGCLMRLQGPLGYNCLEGSGHGSEFVVDTTRKSCNCRCAVGLGPVFCFPRGDSRVNASITARRESTFLFIGMDASQPDAKHVVVGVSKWNPPEK